ncbi:MAG: universal stress protein [Desulfobacula sp.]|jgi:nucleotide-binding universal stress UspA family protein
MNKQNGKIRKLLAAIDFSLYSRPVLEYADEIAGVTNAEVYVINIINHKGIDYIEKAVNKERPDSFNLAKHLAEESGRRELKLKAMIKNINSLDEKKVKIIIGNGVPYVEILDAVDREEIDFLVFGAKGRSNLQGFLFGGVAEKLFRHSPVPVMSLRSKL